MRLRFVLGEIGHGLRRNFSIVVSVILVTFISLTFVGTGFMMQRAINSMKGTWYDQVEVTIRLCPKSSVPTKMCPSEATNDQKEAIQAKLDSEALKPYVKKWYFESKEKAYEELKRSSVSSQSIVKNMTADNMSESYRVKLIDPQQSKVIEEAFGSEAGVAQVQDFHKLLSPIFTLLNQLTAVAWGVAIVMLVAAVLLITTTIRLSALNRRRETGIMRLVGASNSFIQLPFMLEGAIAAAIGALMSITALFFGVRFLSSAGSSAKAVTQGIGTRDVLLVSPILLIIAVALALASSAVALRRYLKV